MTLFSDPKIAILKVGQAQAAAYIGEPMEAGTQDWVAPDPAIINAFRQTVCPHVKVNSTGDLVRVVAIAGNQVHFDRPLTGSVDPIGISGDTFEIYGLSNGLQFVFDQYLTDNNLMTKYEQYLYKTLTTRVGSFDFQYSVSAATADGVTISIDAENPTVIYDYTGLIPLYNLSWDATNQCLLVSDFAYSPLTNHKNYALDLIEVVGAISVPATIRSWSSPSAIEHIKFDSIEDDTIPHDGICLRRIYFNDLLLDKAMQIRIKLDLTVGAGLPI